MDGWIDIFWREKKHVDRLGSVQLLSSCDRFRETVLFLLINVRSVAQLHLRSLAAAELARETQSHQLM